MTSPFTTTNPDVVQSSLRRMIQKSGRVPYAREGAGFICPCPYCGRMTSFRAEELGTQICHDLNRCRSRGTACGGRFTISGNLRSYVLPGGEVIA